MKKDSFPFNNSALKGFRALICGASKGIGRSISKSMAKVGADVIICSRSKEVLDELCDELMNIGANSAKSLALDLENIEEVKKSISELLNEGPIHILINNASGPPGGPLLNVELSEFEPAFKRHLHAAHTITRMLVPGMEESGMGRIVNIISTSVTEVISDALISPGPFASKINFLDPSAEDFNANDFTFKTISVTSSLTPLIDVNSCKTPSIWIDVTAAPLIEDNKILLNELPSVKP